jgi:hypothetical protein
MHRALVVTQIEELWGYGDAFAVALAHPGVDLDRQLLRHLMTPWRARWPAAS